MIVRTRLLVLSLFVGIQALQASAALAAEDPLYLVPEAASGFVVVNRLSGLDAKVQATGRELQLPAPSPLAMLKQLAQAQNGLDEAGTLVFATLPPTGEESMPAPLLFVPVKDYAAFVKQLGADDTSGAVTAVSMMNAPSWARQIGDYAALTDAGHRDALEKLKPSNEASAAVKEWRQWTSEGDIAAVILAPGVKRLTTLAQERLHAMSASFSAGPEQLKAMAGALDVYAKLAKAAGREVSAFGLAIQLDKQNTLRLNTRTSLVAGGAWSRAIAQSRPSKENTLKGLPDVPYLLAGGGEVSEAMMAGLMEFSTSTIASMPGVYGMDEAQTKKLTEVSLPVVRMLRGMSMEIAVARQDEPFYAGVLAIMRVEDSKEFMTQYETSLREYAEIAKSSTSPMMQAPMVEKAEVDGAPAMQLTVKAPPAAPGQNAEEHARMMKAFFGSEGKLVGWVVPAGDRCVVVGYVNKERVALTVKAVKEGESGLAANAEAAKTAAMLPPDRLMEAFVSPAGAVEFIKLQAAAAGKNLKAPPFGKTPPVGIAVTRAPNEVQTTLVVPVEVLQAAAQFAPQLQAAQRSAEGSP